MPGNVESLMAAAGRGLDLGEILGYWAEGGWLLLPLALMCFFIWWIYFSARGRFRVSLRVPPGWSAELEARLGDPSLLDWLGALPGTQPRVVRDVIDAMPRGLGFLEAYGRTRDAEIEAHRHAFRGLGALVVAAPLLGLFGTVLGMVETFEAVAATSWETSERVASGISKALITTELGLIAALPGTFGLAHLMRLQRRLRHELDSFEIRLGRLLAGRGGIRP